MSAIQQVLLSGGSSVTLPEANFLRATVNAYSTFESGGGGNPAIARANITITTSGNIVMVISAAGDVSDPPGAVVAPIAISNTWLQAGNTSVFSARMNGTIVNGASGFANVNEWIPINTSRTWGVAPQRLAIGQTRGTLQANLEIAYTSDPAKTVIANTNVELRAFAFIQ